MVRVRKPQKVVPMVDVATIATFSETPERVKRVAEFGWLASQSEEVKVEVVAKFTGLLALKFSPGEPVSPEATFGLLILATKIIHKQATALERKAKLTAQESSEIQRKNIAGFIENREAKKGKKNAKKASRIKHQFYGLITTLREQRMSWGDISLYLHRHQFIASYAYIQRIYEKYKKELEVEAKKETENAG